MLLPLWELKILFVILSVSSAAALHLWPRKETSETTQVKRMSRVDERKGTVILQKSDPSTDYANNKFYRDVRGLSFLTPFPLDHATMLISSFWWFNLQYDIQAIQQRLESECKDALIYLGDPKKPLILLLGW